MKLYIKLFSLNKFQNLFESNEYLQKVLSETDSNVYLIDSDDLSEIRRLLISNNIKYEIKNS